MSIFLIPGTVAVMLIKFINLLIIKVLEKNISDDLTPLAEKIKAKNKQNENKAKEMISNFERHPTNWRTYSLAIYLIKDKYPRI